MSMKIEIERENDGYLISKNFDDMPFVKESSIKVSCSDMKSLVSQLFLFCESKYVNVSLDFQT